MFAAFARYAAEDKVLIYFISNLIILCIDSPICQLPE